MVFDKDDVGVVTDSRNKGWRRFALTRRSAPLSRQNPTKINLPLGMLLSFFSCLAIRHRGVLDLSASDGLALISSG